MRVESVVAVVDGGSNVVVWWVNVRPAHSASGSRLAGAWVLSAAQASQKLSLLLDGRSVLATPTGQVALNSHEVPADVLIDPWASREAAIREVERLKLVYRDELASKPRRTLVEPNWPSFATYRSEDPGSAREVDVALQIARWMAALATGWDRLESQRLMRSYMCPVDGDAARALPLVRQTPIL